MCNCTGLARALMGEITRNCRRGDYVRDVVHRWSKPRNGEP